MMKRGLLLVGIVLVAWLFLRNSSEKPEVAQGRAHLAELRRSGLLEGERSSVTLGPIRRIVPVATRWSAASEPFWWAELLGSGGSAGYLAWREGERPELLDFSLEGLVAIETPHAHALGGVPAIQQFALKGPDGAWVASGCVPTAAASLIAYWSNRGTFDWQADDSHEGLVRRIRDRLPMTIVPDEEGFTSARMALAGCFPGALAVGLRQDADQYRIPVRLELAPFATGLLAQELAVGQPALVSCTVLLPRDPRLSWGHEVVAVGRAEVAGAHFVGIIDNYHQPRVAGTIRWIQAERCSSLLLVQPVK